MDPPERLHSDTPAAGPGGQPTSHRQITFWALVTFAVLFLVTAMGIAPTVRRDRAVARMLERGSGLVLGSVEVDASHRSRRAGLRRWGAPCQSTARIAYTVDDQPYEILIQDCSLAGVRTGDRARVTFALSDPRVANVEMSGYSTDRLGGMHLVVLSALGLGSAWVATTLYRRGLSRVPRRAVQSRAG